MTLTPDEVVFWEKGFFKLNLTIVTTWVIMIVMVVASKLITRKITSDIKISRSQHLLEMLIIGIRNQIGEIGIAKPDFYLPYLGTLFIFIAFSSLCSIIPFYESPMASLSTTAALACSVFFAVPIFGIMHGGLLNFLKGYIEPSFIMLPFHVISEISRTLALAIRLFGNMMSESMIIGILLTITPLVFPVVMKLFGLFTGMVQAYIFSILSAVFIAAATQHGQEKHKNS